MNKKSCLTKTFQIATHAVWKTSVRLTFTSMNPKGLRFIAYAGIILSLFLSVWYLMKTYNEGNPRWIYLVMAAGVAVLLSQMLGGGRRR